MERKWRQRLQTTPSRDLAARGEKGSGARGGSSQAKVFWTGNQRGKSGWKGRGAREHPSCLGWKGRGAHDHPSCLCPLARMVHQLKGRGQGTH